MNPLHVDELLSGLDESLLAQVARPVLWAASWPYAAAMSLRRTAYQRGMLASHAAGVPVICVGNITTGGTGKTPTVAWVANLLSAHGRSPAVLTRGYRGVGGSSDEADLLARLTAAPVHAFADRVVSAGRAVAAGADVLVLDDGFQHRRLRRDLDIVLIDSTRPFGYGYCLPRGLLREPLSALADVEAIVITRRDRIKNDAAAKLREQLHQLAPRAAIAEAYHCPTAVTDAKGTHLVAPEGLAGRRVLAFCGVGNPEAFFHTLRDLGARLINTLAFEDHVIYDSYVLDQVNSASYACSADWLITTEKDAVKIDPTRLRLPLRVLAVQLDVLAGREQLISAILTAAGVATPAAAE